MIPPPVIKKGDGIGIIAPAGPIVPEVFKRGVQLLEGLGFTVFHSPDILEESGYLAGTDQRRTKEFHALWANPSVKIIIAARGGFGTSRLIEQLDYDLIARSPKILVGFSDLTILLNAIYQKTGLVTFHGPMLSTLVRDGKATLDIFNQLTKPNFENIKARPLEILRDGSAQGVLVGGNLTCFQHLSGTPFMPAGGEKILFIEDINEPAYRVDRCLTYLKMIGVLDGFAGIILGKFLSADLSRQADCELIWNRVLELTEKIPIWADFPVGHGKENLLMPIGTTVTMDSSAGILRFSGPSCQA